MLLLLAVVAFATASELSLEIDATIVSELNAEHELEMEVHADTELEVASMCSRFDLACKAKEAAGTHMLTLSNQIQCNGVLDTWASSYT